MNKITMKKIIICLIILLMGLCLTGFSNSTDNIVQIEDPNLEKVIRERLGKPSGELTVSEIENIGRLNTNDLGIKTLKGLEKITKIKEWDLSKNQLTDVDGLRNLVEADSLYLQGNQLKNIDGLKNLKRVKELILRNNQLTNVDGLSSLSSSVIDLDLSINQLINVDGLNNLARVKYLDLYNNQIENIDGLRRLKKTEVLSLGKNQLTNVDGLSNLFSVQELDLSDNKIMNIDGLKNLACIEELYLDYNRLYPVNINGEETEIARENKSFVNELKKIVKYHLEDEANEYLIFDLSPTAHKAEKITEEDFSFKKFGYGTKEEDIQKELGESTEEWGYTKYSDKFAIQYRDETAKGIWCYTAQYSTVRDIKIGDSVKNIIDAYGKPDEARIFDNGIIYIEYYKKNAQTTDDILILQFGLENKEVKKIYLGDSNTIDYSLLY